MYILEELANIPDLNQRATEAGKWLDQQYLKQEFPRGFFIPDCTWPSQDKTESRLKNEVAFWNRMDELLNSVQPKNYIKIRSQFERMYQQMIELANCTPSELSDLANEDLPPYFYDFNWAVKLDGRAKNGIISPTIQQIQFYNQFIAKGGFGEIYLAQNYDGRKLILKMGHVPWKYPLGRRSSKRKMINQIKHNVRSKRKILSQKPFARLVEIFPGKNPSMYVAEFIQGQNVNDLLYLYKRRLKPFPEEKIGQILLTYAEMLEMLHKEDMIYLDNKLSNIIYNRDRVAICDFDFVSSIKDAQRDNFFAKKIKTPVFISREQVLERDFRQVSDLESFALMIDSLFYLDYFLISLANSVKSNKILKTCQNFALVNKRHYPICRQERLPHPLRDIVKSLLEYPRDESITATDMKIAIQLTFGL